jgi:hypothetical protein
MSAISKRNLMKGGAALAVAAAVPAIARANQDDDAELLKLWQEWKAQRVKWLIAVGEEMDADEAAMKAWPPKWHWVGAMQILLRRTRPLTRASAAGATVSKYSKR